MLALINTATNELAGIVASLDGIDLTGLHTFEPVPLPPHEYVWNPATSQFDPRPPTAAEVTASALEADTRWQALKAASPDQIDAWLTANVVDLASARRVLKIFALAIQRLARTR